MSSPSVTLMRGVQDKAIFTLSHDKLLSLTQVLPTVRIKSWCKNQLYVISMMLTPFPVPPFPELIHVFMKDLKQLTADWRATDAKSAVIRRYRDALFAKVEVRYEFWSGFGSVVLTP